MSRPRTANLLGALAGEAAERLERRQSRHPNATDSSAAALNVLAFWEGASNARLAAVLGLSHPATVRLADKLEAEGLLESRRGRDRRSVALYLTEAGRARDILNDRCVALTRVTDALSPDERDQFAALMEKMLRALTGGLDEADHICRLCDSLACPQDDCPVQQAALAEEARKARRAS